MQMSFPASIHAPSWAGALCVVIACCTAGCASKNPLMEEPVAAGSAVKTAAVPVAVKPAESKQAAGNANSGVQTTETRGFFGFLALYRPNIQQGNFVSSEMFSQLKTGMTPDQVRFILGTPLLNDIFHADRWDYVFRLKKGNGEVISSRIAVFFKDRRLARIDGGDLPTENDYLALISGVPSAPKTAAPAVTAVASPAAK